MNYYEFQAFAVLFACLSVAAANWSCEECDRAKEELTNILTSEAGMEIQVNHILSDYCPNSADAANCEAFVPDFWKAIAMQLWPEAISHLCADIEDTCESGVALTCSECQLRLDWKLETLRDPVVEGYWVQTLTEGSFCSDNYSGLEDLCKGHLKDVFPKVLYVMTENAWVPAFCSDFGCKE